MRQARYYFKIDYGQMGTALTKSRTLRTVRRMIDDDLKRYGKNADEIKIVITRDREDNS